MAEFVWHEDIWVIAWFKRQFLWLFKNSPKIFSGLAKLIWFFILWLGPIYGLAWFGCLPNPENRAGVFLFFAMVWSIYRILLVAKRLEDAKLAY